jgi:septum formation protein
MSQREMEYYVDQYRPMDKAGGYGIQEWIGMVCITGIKGDYYNVMGLPTRKVWEMMQKYVVW